MVFLSQSRWCCWSLVTTVKTPKNTHSAANFFNKSNVITQDSLETSLFYQSTKLCSLFAANVTVFVQSIHGSQLVWKGVLNKNPLVVIFVAGNLRTSKHQRFSEKPGLFGLLYLQKSGRKTTRQPHVGLTHLKRRNGELTPFEAVWSVNCSGTFKHRFFP